MLSTLTPPWVRNGGNLWVHHAGGQSGAESLRGFPRATQRARNSEHSHSGLSANSVRLFGRKFLDIRFCLPSYPRPGRVLWCSPWAPVLEVTVYFGRRPGLGGEPPPQHSAQREVIIFIYIQGLAGLGLGDGGSWRQREKYEYISGITWWGGANCFPPRHPPPPTLGFVPSR